MTWDIISTKSEEEFFEEYVHEVLAQAPAELPPVHFKIGNAEVSWFQSEPGTAIINTAGGAIEDRLLAETVVREQLRGHNIKQAQFNFDGSEELRKTANWDDIAAKAKRLIQSGNVQLLRNGYNNIVAQVQGDHGTYQSEIGRDDPNSRSITTWQCFLPDAPVTLDNGEKVSISIIKPGDRVLTHTGESKNVLNAWSSLYTGRLAHVKLAGMDQWVTATENHPVLTANEDYHLQHLVGWRGKNKRGTVPRYPDCPNLAVYEPVAVAPKVEWSEVGSLVPGDYLSLTAPQGEESFAMEFSGSRLNKNQSCVIEVNKDIAYLLGWYIAEGCLVKSNGKYTNRVSFTVHTSELEYIEQLDDICFKYFGVRGTIRYPKNCNTIDYRVSHYAIKQLCEKLVGYNTRDRKSQKLLDRRLLTLPKDIQESLIDGWAKGDGSIDKKRRSIGTAIENLANQAHLILLRLGHVSSVAWTDDNGRSPLIANSDNCQRFYTVRWTFGETKRQPNRFIQDEKGWYRIEKIILESFEGFVYDLEVEEDHSFQAYGANVHNCECEWDQYAWQRSRKWKKFEGRPCWKKDSLVTMADGTHKPIQLVRPGEEVLATNGVSRVESVWENLYTGGMRTIRRVGNYVPSTVTDDHKMIIHSTARDIFEADAPFATRRYRMRKALHTNLWDKRLAKDVRVNDWVQITYPTEVKSFSIDTESLSPYFHQDGDVVYKSVYAKNSLKMDTLSQHQAIKPHDLSDESVDKLYSRIEKTDKHWIWQGALDPSTNQLRFACQGKNRNVRKLVWETERGSRPEGARVMSQCGEVRCVKPDHVSVKDKTRLGQRARQTLAATLYPSEELLTVAGYYLAEGSFENHNCDVSWTFAKKEIEYIDRLEEALLKLNAGRLRKYPHPIDNKIAVKISNSVLVEVLRYLCGTGSRTKKLAPELMLMEPKLQRFFLERYAEGDGCESKYGYTISTTSDELAQQIVTMGSRVYETIPGVAKIKNCGGPTNRDKKLFINQIRFNQKYNHGVERLRPGFYAARITKIEESEHDGFVYNLTVPPTHTVAVDGILSFQCSHVLATFWSSLAAPLDEDAHPEQQQLLNAPAGPAPPASPAPLPTPGAPPPQGEQLQIPGMQPPPDGPNILPQFPMDPALQPQVNPISMPGQKPQTPLNPIQNAGGTFSSWNFDGHNTSANISVVSAPPKNPVNGDMVSAKYDDWGTWQGRSDEHGAGSNAKVPAGSVGEVLGTDPTTGMINVLFTGKQSEQKGEMGPWGITAWFLPSELHARSDVRKPGPAVRRRK